MSAGIDLPRAERPAGAGVTAADDDRTRLTDSLDVASRCALLEHDVRDGRTCESTRDLRTEVHADGGPFRGDRRNGGDSPSAALGLAAFAAVFPDVVRERPDRGKLGRIEVEGALAPALEQTGIDEALQVVAERRRRQIDVLLDCTRSGPFGAALDDEPQDGQTNGMPECAELLSVTFKLRAHAVILTNSNHRASIFFETVRRKPFLFRCHPVT